MIHLSGRRVFIEKSVNGSRTTSYHYVWKRRVTQRNHATLIIRLFAEDVGYSELIASANRCST